MFGLLLTLGFGVATAAAIAAATQRKADEIERLTGQRPTFTELTQATIDAMYAANPLTKGSSGSSAHHVVDRGTFVRGIVMQSPTRQNPHWGIDIGAPEGTPIRAVKSGTIILSRPVTGYGNCIFLRHDEGGQSTLYGHMQRATVQEGQHVTAGQQIGAVGRTTQGQNIRYEGDRIVSVGNSTSGAVVRAIGPHLHMEVHPTPTPRIGPTPRRLDPVRWLRQQGIEQYAERWRPGQAVDMGVA